MKHTVLYLSNGTKTTQTNHCVWISLFQYLCCNLVNNYLFQACRSFAFINTLIYQFCEFCLRSLRDIAGVMRIIMLLMACLLDGRIRGSLQGLCRSLI